MYTTRSGYLTLSEALNSESPTNQATATDWLANVWNVKTMEKIKVFIWRSLHDALPVGEQFGKRNI